MIRGLFITASDRIVEVEGIIWSFVMMHNGPDGLDHCHGSFRLEDVPPHVHSGRALLNGLIGHLQGIKFRDFLPACYYDRDWATGRDRFKIFFNIIGFDVMSPQFRTYSCSQPELARVPDHIFADCSDGHGWNAVTGSQIN